MGDCRGGAPGGTRTPTPLRVPDFESGASTGSATGAANGRLRLGIISTMVFRSTRKVLACHALVAAAGSVRAKQARNRLIGQDAGDERSPCLASEPCEVKQPASVARAEPVMEHHHRAAAAFRAVLAVQARL